MSSAPGRLRCEEGETQTQAVPANTPWTTEARAGWMASFFAVVSNFSVKPAGVLGGSFEETGGAISRLA